MAKAQFAVEYLMVISIGLLILIPGIYYFYSYSNSQTKELTDAQLFNLGNKIVNEAETLFALGPPSKYTFTAAFPDGLNNINISPNHKELIFNLSQERGELVFVSDVPLDGIFYNDTGVACTDVCFTPGTKKIILIAYDSNVSIILR